MLTFDPIPHVYRWCDRIVPGVTSVLAPLERSFAFVDEGVLEAARRFGSHCHRAIELFNEGTLDEAELDPALEPYLSAWKRFVCEADFEVAAGEQAVYHPQLRYAGRLDIRGFMRGTSWLIDLKSGAVPRTCQLQTAGYCLAVDVRPRRRAALQLKGDGSYNLIEHTDPADFSYFQSALNIYRWKEKHA